MPFLRFDAPSRVSTPILPSAVVLMSFMMRASNAERIDLQRRRGIADVVHPKRPAIADVTYMKSPTIHCSRTWNSSTGARPTTSNSRCTLRGLTTTDAVALRSPLIAVMTYAPGRSATKTPSASTEARRSPADRPAKRRHVDRAPLAFFAVARSRTTSPVRTDVVAGSMARVATGFRTTVTGTVAVAAPLVTRIVARPIATPVTTPPRPPARRPGVSDAQRHRGIAARHAGPVNALARSCAAPPGTSGPGERRDVKTRDRLRPNGHRNRGGLAADDDADGELAGVEERHRAARLRDADVERRREPGRRLHVHLRAGGVERLDA